MVNPIIALIEAKKKGVSAVPDAVKRPLEFSRPKVFPWQAAAFSSFVVVGCVFLAKFSVMTTPKTLNSEWEKESERLRKTGDFNKYVNPNN